MEAAMVIDTVNGESDCGRCVHSEDDCEKLCKEWAVINIEYDCPYWRKQGA